MKKLTVIILALALTLTLAACGGDDTGTQQGGTNEPAYEIRTPDPQPATENDTYYDPDPTPEPEVEDYWVVVPDKDMYISIHTYFDGVAIANYASSGMGGKASNQNTFTALDTNGNELFPPTDKYYYISPFSYGMAVVDAKASFDDSSIYGLIDINGNEIVPPGKYERFMTGYSGEPTDTVIIVQDSEWKYGVIDNTGKEIVPIGTYATISQFNGGAAVVSDADGKSGAIDKTGNLIIPFGEYVSFWGFSDGVTAAYSPDRTQWTIIDSTGAVLMPLTEKKYDEIGGFSDGVAVVSNWSGGCGVIDKTGTELIPLSSEYNRIRDFNDGVAVAEDTDGKYGVIDKSGNLIVPFGKYDRINSFDCGVALVYDDTNNVTGVIDTSGNEIVPLGKYGNAYLQFENCYAVYQVHFDDGSDPVNIVLDNTGREIIYASFREFSPHHTVSKEGLLVVSENSRAGIIDLNKWES